jgi:hypothetical protein
VPAKGRGEDDRLARAARHALAIAAISLHPGCDRAECGSSQGFIFGTIFGEGTIEAALYNDAGVLVETITPNARGRYELHVDPGSYMLAASSFIDSDTGGQGYESCSADDVQITIEACDEQKVDLVLHDCITADKPNLYLYPAQDTPTTVRLKHSPQQRVFASDPPYDGAWTGVAHPDGTFTPDGGDTAPFLFYEITLLPGHVRSLQRAAGVCVGGANAVEDMAALLGAWGFSPREQADFIEGWKDDLPRRASYRVYPQRAVDPIVGVDIQPPLPLSRLWLRVEDGAGCVPAAAPPAGLTPIPRAGPHAVEWGVVLSGLR